MALHRYVATQPGTYAIYITQYAPRGTTATTATKGQVITISDDASSGVLKPIHLRYLDQPHGKRVRLERGIVATLTSSKGLVSVSWRFPKAGAPAYLNGVTTVTLSGHDVSKATVLAVARSVRPD